MNTLFGIFSWLTGNGFRSILDRALQTVDKKIESETDRNRLKADIVKAHLQTRSSWLEAGGLWTLLLFAVPTSFHYAAVVVYSVFWCAGCAYPQEWTIAALPGVMADWEGKIVLASIGGISLISGLKALGR